MNDCSLYLDLMESVLTGMIEEDPAFSGKYDLQTREIGGDWPTKALTMIGRKRLHQLRLACEDVIQRGITGDFIECGVWRGGACIMMRAVMLAMNDNMRTVYLADSFAGLPAPRHPVDKNLKLHEHDELAVDVHVVKNNLAKFGFNDTRSVCVVGDFSELGVFAKKFNPLFSIVRLDGDMYQSTIDAIEVCYPRLVRGGYLIVDDYGAMPECRRAIEDYRRQHGIACERKTIDWGGIYWIKE